MILKGEGQTESDRDDGERAIEMDRKRGGAKG